MTVGKNGRAAGRDAFDRLTVPINREIGPRLPGWVGRAPVDRHEEHDGDEAENRDELPGPGHDRGAVRQVAAGVALDGPSAASRRGAEQHVCGRIRADRLGVGGEGTAACLGTMDGRSGDRGCLRPCRSYVRAGCGGLSGRRSARGPQWRRSGPSKTKKQRLHPGVLSVTSKSPSKKSHD